MKTKPLDVPTAARAMRMTEKQVRRLRDYDPSTNTVQVPVFIVNQVEHEKAKAEFRRTVNEALRPMVERTQRTMLAFARALRLR